VVRIQMHMTFTSACQAFETRLSDNVQGIVLAQW
jgi:hypothetical protein